MDDDTISAESALERRRLLRNTLLAFALGISAYYVLPWAFFAFGSGSFAIVLTALALYFAALAVYRPKKLPHEADDIIEEYIQRNLDASAMDIEVGKELLENALHLEEVKVRDCITPRNEVVFVNIETDIDTLRNRFVESGLSRILVVEDGDLDRVLGYVHAQQMFRPAGQIRQMLLPLQSAPESMPVSALLDRFIRSRSNIFGVVDEYGSMSGIVTLEDALEQLFGDIEDEYDQEELMETRVGERELLLSGRLKVSYLNEKYPELQIPEGDYNTLSGYLVTATQTIPEQDARLQLGEKTFVLEAVSDRKIDLVRVFL